jgi:hypothetical protein
MPKLPNYDDLINTPPMPEGGRPHWTPPPAEPVIITENLIKIEAMEKAAATRVMSEEDAAKVARRVVEAARTSNPSLVSDLKLRASQAEEKLIPDNALLQGVRTYGRQMKEFTPKPIPGSEADAIRREEAVKRTKGDGSLIEDVMPGTVPDAVHRCSICSSHRLRSRLAWESTRHHPDYSPPQPARGSGNGRQATSAAAPRPSPRTRPVPRSSFSIQTRGLARSSSGSPMKAGWRCRPRGMSTPSWRRSRLRT